MTLALLTAARGISSLGDGLHYIAMAWLVMSSTGLALSASALVVARALPGAVFTLFGGGAADAFDRRRLLCWIWAGQGLITATVPVG